MGGVGGGRKRAECGTELTGESPESPNIWFITPAAPREQHTHTNSGGLKGILCRSDTHSSVNTRHGRCCLPTDVHCHI